MKQQKSAFDREFNPHEKFYGILDQRFLIDEDGKDLGQRSEMEISFTDYENATAGSLKLKIIPRDLPNNDLYEENGRLRAGYRLCFVDLDHGLKFHEGCVLEHTGEKVFFCIGVKEAEQHLVFGEYVTV